MGMEDKYVMIIAWQVFFLCRQPQEPGCFLGSCWHDAYSVLQTSQSHMQTNLLLLFQVPELKLIEGDTTSKVKLPLLKHTVQLSIPLKTA